jgi:hypothetical protein
MDTAGLGSRSERRGLDLDHVGTELVRRLGGERRRRHVRLAKARAHRYPFAARPTLPLPAGPVRREELPVQPVPPKPVFAAIDMTPLDHLDWTDKSAAGAALKGLQVDVEGNSKLRADYMSAALLAAKERLREMQASAAFGKKADKDTSQVNTDDKLKTARDEVKVMMNESTDVERDYFGAMQAFRERGNLDFAGSFAPFLKQLRVKVQDADKAVSAAPGQIKALEGFSSGLIKQIREMRGAIEGNLQRLEKIEDARKKAEAMATEASTNLSKMASSVKGMTGYLETLPKTEAQLKGTAIDFEVRYKKFYLSMGAIQTLNDAIGTLIKGFTGIGFEDSAKPHQKAVDAALAKLITERDAVEKDYKKLLKQKAFPAEIAKDLPKDLHA